MIPVITGCILDVIGLIKKDYKAFQDDQDESFYCLLCMNDIMPYSKLNDIEFERISAKGVFFNKMMSNFLFLRK